MMTQMLWLNIVVIGLLAGLFASIQRLRFSTRVSLWMQGWLCVLAHFGLLLWQPATVRLVGLQDALATASLLLCGLCFVLSSTVLASETWRTRVAFALGLPAFCFVALSSFHAAAPISYFVLDIAGHGIALALLWYRFDGRLRIAIPATLLVILCSHWILYQIIGGQPEAGVPLILAEFFAMYALLFYDDHRRRSAGVLTTVCGLLCWAAVFPASLLLAASWPALHVEPEVWNVPKFFVAFGMIVTLLEEEAALARRQSAQYQMLFRENPLPMWIADQESREMLEVNAAASAAYGYSRAEFLSMTMDQLIENPGEHSAALAWSESRRSETPFALRKRNGELSLIEVSAKPVDFEGTVAQLVLAHDVTERLKLHEQLLHQANHDPLTGLPNRLLLEDRMKLALASAARHGARAAILCLDLDRFKQINDTYGHAFGDSCLKATAARLTQRLRTVDTAARTGGEEFLVILDQIRSAGDAERVAEDLLRAIRAPQVIDGERVELTTSLGIAVFPEDATEPADLWHLADAALYQAKRDGGNCYRMANRAREAAPPAVHVHRSAKGEAARHLGDARYAAPVREWVRVLPKSER